MQSSTIQQSPQSNLINQPKKYPIKNFSKISIIINFYIQHKIYPIIKKFMGVNCCISKISKKEKQIPRPLNTNLLIEAPDLYSDSLYFKPRQKSYYQKLLLTEPFPSEISCPESFEKISLIGKGSYGQVFIIKIPETNEIMALKEIPLISLSGTDSMCKEVQILSQLNHPNIVRYLGSKLTDTFLLIFMEYIAGGTVQSLLYKHGPFTEPLIKEYLSQILRGLEYLHYHNIVHRDIKSTNILVSEDGICKLADFGSAKNILGQENTLSVTGTIHWMAPEVLNGTGHGRYADIWGIGCLVIEMLTGQMPWNELITQNNVILKVLESQDLPKIPENVSDALKDLLSYCFMRRPNDRLNIGQLLAHRFLINEGEKFNSGSTNFASD